MSIEPAAALTTPFTLTITFPFPVLPLTQHRRLAKG
jgi:hypothetical protein